MSEVRTRTIVRTDAARAGIGLGSAIAVAISWSQHESIIWAIVQGFFGWLYVIYYALTRPGGLTG